uniref:Immunoglobulin V-set domain-containing protein n=1 Tax=Pundamilia nyererei TaxID=303518 RepID=A0A3B4H4J8_9CICH
INISLLAKHYFRSAVGMIHVTGYVGREVNGYESYEKYLCKNDCGDSDLLITTSNSSKNKYSIHDNKTSRIFTTTISDLHSVDAGKYWCGVTRTGKDIYTELMVSFTVMYTWTCLHSNIDANIDANEVQPLCILCIFRSR